jgi:hypothetical protein
LHGLQQGDGLAVGQAGLGDGEVGFKVFKFPDALAGWSGQPDFFGSLIGHIDRKGFDLLQGIHSLSIEQIFYINKGKDENFKVLNYD